MLERTRRLRLCFTLQVIGGAPLSVAFGVLGVLAHL